LCEATFCNCQQGGKQSNKQNPQHGSCIYRIGCGAQGLLGSLAGMGKPLSPSGEGMEERKNDWMRRAKGVGATKKSDVGTLFEVSCLKESSFEGMVSARA